MKSLKTIILILSVIFIVSSCKKTDSTPANSFTFKGKTYTITNSALEHVIFNNSGAKLVHTYLFAFGHISGADTTVLVLTVFDESTSVLSGTYNSIDENDTLATRGIVPFAFFVMSGITNNNPSFDYFTGAGGNLGISWTPSAGDTIYKLSFNSISAGQYGNNFEQYTEAGKITGNFDGALFMSQNSYAGLSPNQGQASYRKSPESAMQKEEFLKLVNRLYPSFNLQK